MHSIHLAVACCVAALAQSSKPAGTSPAEPSAVEVIRRDAAALRPLVRSKLARDFLGETAHLPDIQPRTIYRDAKKKYYAPDARDALPAEDRAALSPVQISDTLYYNTKYGSPLAYVRPLDVLAEHGMGDVAGKKIVDFGYGGVGHLRLLAGLGANVVGVDVDSFLAALYSRPEDQGRVASAGGRTGSLRLLTGRYPADATVRQSVGDGCDLFISKNTLKNGYLHPERPVDKRMLVDLGMPDEEFVIALFDMLKPGGKVLIYNLCPAPAPPDKPYIPWADGRCPFPEDMLKRTAFRVLAYNKKDDAAARAMGRALGWDQGEGAMELEKDLFAWYTLFEKPSGPEKPAPGR